MQLGRKLGGRAANHPFAAKAFRGLKETDACSRGRRPHPLATSSPHNRRQKHDKRQCGRQRPRTPTAASIASGTLFASEVAVRARVWLLMGCGVSGEANEAAPEILSCKPPDATQVALVTVRQLFKQPGIIPDASARMMRAEASLFGFTWREEGRSVPLHQHCLSLSFA